MGVCVHVGVCMSGWVGACARVCVTQVNSDNFSSFKMLTFDDTVVPPYTPIQNLQCQLSVVYCGPGKKIGKLWK
jgi:hypothetical protein